MTAYTIYDVTVSVLTPLHIGSGKDLLNEYDYSIRNGRTWCLNESALLDAQDVEDADTAALLGRTPPAQLLQERDFHPDSRLFRYILAGTPRSQAPGAQLREQIKDAFDRPYLPGSSFKGALRTALAWNMWRQKGMRPDISKIGRNPRWAAQQLERELFGRDPNHDLLRALHVSDSAPANTDRLLILNASVISSQGKPGAPIEMEAIAPDTQFRLTLKVDDALFSDWATHKRLPLEGKDLLTDLPARGPGPQPRPCPQRVDMVQRDFPGPAGRRVLPASGGFAAGRPPFPAQSGLGNRLDEQDLRVPLLQETPGPDGTSPARLPLGPWQTANRRPLPQKPARRRPDEPRPPRPSADYSRPRPSAGAWLK